MAKNSKTKSPERGLWENTDLAGNKEASINDPVGAKLQISTTDKKVLTKNQQAFNRLTKQIEKLENQIVTETKKLDKLTELFSTEIVGVEIETAQAQLELAVAFNKIIEEKKFTKSEKKNIQEVIVSMFNMAFCKLEPTPEQEAIHDKWAKTSYKEELARQEMDEHTSIEDLFNEFFGETPFDEDDNLFDLENFEKEFSDASDTNNQKFNRKTTKQQKQEEALRVEQALKNKSVRSIYISLAKILHPDAETDPEIKHYKEEVMKQVTVAYEQKDLQTLLRLEMEWIHKTSDHLDQLSEDKLKTYIAVLKEQVEQLKSEKHAVKYNPRYQIIGELMFLTEKQAIKQISQQKQFCQQTNDELKKIIEVVSNSSSKTKIVEIAKEFVLAINIMNDFMTDFESDEFEF